MAERTALLLTFLLIAGCSQPPTSQSFAQLGDPVPTPLWRLYADSSTPPGTQRVITAGDAVTALRIIVGLEQSDQRQRVLCDANGNGQLSAIDATYILKQAVGLGVMPQVARCGGHWIYWPSGSAPDYVTAVPPDPATCGRGYYAVYAVPTPDADGAQHIEGLNFDAGYIGDCNRSWPGT